MINLKDTVSKVIRNYDFGELVSEALIDIDVESLVFDAVCNKIADMDFSDIVERHIECALDYIVDEFEEDIRESFEEALEDILFE